MNRSEYRKFRIRGVEGANDFASMHEVVTRRYRRLLEEGKPLPDLIVIDGGKGQLNAAYAALEALPMPCVALVHGAAIGSGVEIAAACDFIVATPEATFRTPEAQRGTVGATQRLPRILGKRLAKDLMFTGRALTAAEALANGLVSRLGDLEEQRKIIAEAILKAPPLALKLAKRTIDRGIELDPKGALEAELEAIEQQLASGQWMGKT